MIRGVLLCGIGNVLFQAANMLHAARRLRTTAEFGYVDMSSPANRLPHRHGALYGKIFSPWGGHAGSRWELGHFFHKLRFSSQKYKIDASRKATAASAEVATADCFCVVDKWTYTFLDFADWKNDFEVNPTINAELKQKWVGIDWTRPVVHLRAGSKGDNYGFRQSYDATAIKWAFDNGKPYIITDNPARTAEVVRECCGQALDFDVIGGDDPLEDMWLLMQAETLVLSRSTLSMWAAYLGRAKQIIVGPEFRDDWHIPHSSWRIVGGSPVIKRPIECEKPLLSILIPTTPDRSGFLSRLMSILNRQNNGRFEVVVCEDRKQSTIGEKRNILLREARGEWICFADDDDEVVPDYIPAIWPGLTDENDVVALHILYYENGVFRGNSFHSLKYDSWSENRAKREYYRCPNHLNPVKKTHALAAGFPEKNHGEDHVYSLNLRPFLKKEYNANKPLYKYLFRSSK